MKKWASIDQSSYQLQRYSCIGEINDMNKDKMQGMNYCLKLWPFVQCVHCLGKEGVFIPVPFAGDGSVAPVRGKEFKMFIEGMGRVIGYLTGFSGNHLV